MKRLAILAAGSRGDVLPCVALGRGLAEAGYAVRVVTHASFEALVRGQGLDFTPIPGDAQALTTEMMRGQMGNRGLNLLAMYRGVMRTFGALTASYQAAFTDPDLFAAQAILCQLPGGFYGYDLAEHLGVPYLALSVIPQEVTGAWPLALLPSTRSFGRAYNRLTYRLGQQLAWRPFQRPINAFRKALGLPPASFWWGNMRRMARERVPVLQGFSPQVVPPQPEWRAHVHTTGYWTLAEADWQPPAALREFLASGEPPVFIGFGSMSAPEPQQTTDLILTALQRSGQRGLLHAGWAELGQANLPGNVFSLDYAPYAWLFPQMAAVIHHGGSGTTGLALRAGVPSLVVPFTADQPFWGQRTQALGAGPAPIPFPKLNADNLAEAIQALTGEPRYRQRAAALRETMAGEDGVERAVAVIQQYLG